MKKDILQVGLDPLLHFESIARFKSLKKAAEELHLSQPAVTQSLSKLENNLGVKLCVRSRANFALTEVGQRLFQIGKEMKDNLRGFESFLTKEEEFDGLLSIGVIDNFQNNAFEEAIKKTIHLFPKMKMSIQVHAATEIQALVATGEIDVGLGIFNRKLDQLTYRVIGEETIGHYISDKHPLWSKREVKVEDLEGFTKTWVDIINRSRSTLDAEIFSGGRKQVAKVRSYANNLNAAVLILRSGTSIVPLPAEYLESRHLDFKFRPLNKVFSQYSVKQEITVHTDFLNASPASRFFLEQLPKFSGK